MRNTTIALRYGLLALCLTAAAGPAHAWTAPERVDRKPTGHATYYPCIAVGRDGLPRAAWEERFLNHTLDKVMYARRDGDTWTVPLNVSRDSGDIRFPAIALDSFGRAVVVWSQEGSATIRYARQVNDTWSSPKLCFSNGGITPRLASVGRGRIHLLFEDLAHQGGIWYSNYVAEADSWATPTRVALGIWTLGWSNLAVDRFDHLHAVWMDWGTNGLDYVFNDGTGWSQSVRLPDPDTTSQSCTPCIAVDRTGEPYVFWQERSNGYWLYSSHREDSVWTAPGRFDTAQGGDPSACGDSTGRVHVVWNCWDHDGLVQAACFDSGWSVPETVDTPSCFESAVTVAGSALHVVWRRGGSLFYSVQALPGVSEADTAVLRASGNWLRSIVGTPFLALHLDEPETVDLLVYDVAGAEVGHTSLGLRLAGTHTVRVPVAGLASGVYFCRARMGDSVGTAKIIRTR